MPISPNRLCLPLLILTLCGTLAQSATEEPYEKALSRWAMELKEENSNFVIQSVEKIQLTSNVLFLVRGTRAWRDNPDSVPSEFIYLFQATSPEDSWYELYRVSDRNRCGANSFKDFKLTPLRTIDAEQQWQLDFRFVSFGCESSGITSDHKVINHFYLLLNEHPRVSVAYQSDFMLNQEIKFSPRKHHLLMMVFGEKPNSTTSGRQKDPILLWRIDQQLYVKKSGD